MEDLKRAMLNWKTQLIIVGIIIISELIGTHALNTPIGTLLFMPMIFSILLGIAAGFLASKLKLGVLKENDQHDANSMLLVAVLLLLVKVGSTAGPNFYTVIRSGWALILQEFGNVGTAFLAVPGGVAMGLKREVVGGGHSISRDTNLALITEMYGLDSAEGRGVAACFLYGGLFGAIIMGVLTPFVASWNVFSVEALAMATGVGSTSFTAAGSASLINLFPDKEQIILAFSASSSLLTGFDAVWITLACGLPLTRWLYKVCYRIKYKQDPEPEVRRDRKELAK